MVKILKLCVFGIGSLEEALEKNCFFCDAFPNSKSLKTAITASIVNHANTEINRLDSVEALTWKRMQAFAETNVENVGDGKKPERVFEE